MKPARLALLTPLLLAALPGCTTEDNCDDARSGDFALLLSLPKSECAEVAGTAENLDTGEDYTLSCEVQGSRCLCRGGDEFGTYRVNLEYAERDETQTALFDVFLSPTPQCVTRDPLEAFSLVGAGGAGGAGGARN